MENMGIRNNIEEAMETTTRAKTIQATKVILMELVITAMRLYIRRKIDIRKIGMDKEILTELLINATSLNISKKIATRNKGMNKHISKITNNQQKLF